MRGKKAKLLRRFSRGNKKAHKMWAKVLKGQSLSGIYDKLNYLRSATPEERAELRSYLD